MFQGLFLFSSNVTPTQTHTLFFFVSEAVKAKLRSKTAFLLQGKVFPYTFPVLYIWKQKLYFKINTLPVF